VKTLKRTIEMYPRYKIAALNQPPSPHRRVRRTREQMKAGQAGARTPARA
jgi:hypothetical protein